MTRQQAHEQRLEQDRQTKAMKIHIRQLEERLAKLEHPHDPLFKFELREQALALRLDEIEAKIDRLRICLKRSDLIAPGAMHAVDD